MRAAVVASANTRLAFGHLTRMATSGCAIEVDPCLVLLKGFALGRVASAGASHRGVSAGDREQREQRERTAVFMVFLFEGTGSTYVSFPQRLRCLPSRWQFDEDLFNILAIAFDYGSRSIARGVQNPRGHRPKRGRSSRSHRAALLSSDRTGRQYHRRSATVGPSVRASSYCIPTR